MTQLILHIGVRKTGSSALEELVARESEVLHEHGLDYPASLMPFPAHQELAWSVMDNVPRYVKELLDKANRPLRQIIRLVENRLYDRAYRAWKPALRCYM